MRLCDLRHVPGTTEPYFTLTGDLLVLTLKPEAMLVCPHCPNIHVRVLAAVTPTEIRGLASQFLTLANQLEAR